MGGSKEQSGVYIRQTTLLAHTLVPPERNGGMSTWSPSGMVSTSFGQAFPVPFPISVFGKVTEQARSPVGLVTWRIARGHFEDGLYLGGFLRVVWCVFWYTSVTLLGGTTFLFFRCGHDSLGHRPALSDQSRVTRRCRRPAVQKAELQACLWRLKPRTSRSRDGSRQIETRLLLAVKPFILHGIGHPCLFAQTLQNGDWHSTTYVRPYVCENVVGSSMGSGVDPRTG